MLPPALAGITAAERDALVHECRDGNVPAIAFAPQHHRRRDAHVGHEDLVELGLARYLEQRSHLDTGCMHVEHEIRHALVLGNVGIRARHQHAPPRPMRQCGPHLLAVDDPLVAVANGARVASDATSLPAPGSLKSWHQMSSPVKMRPQQSLVQIFTAVQSTTGRAMPMPIGLRPYGTGAPAAANSALIVFCCFRRQTQWPAVALGEVHPREAEVVLRAEELRGRRRLGIELREEVVAQLGHTLLVRRQRRLLSELDRSVKCTDWRHDRHGLHPRRRASHATPA